MHSTYCLDCSISRREPHLFLIVNIVFFVHLVTNKSYVHCQRRCRYERLIYIIHNGMSTYQIINIIHEWIWLSIPTKGVHQVYTFLPRLYRALLCSVSQRNHVGDRLSSSSRLYAKLIFTPNTSWSGQQKMTLYYVWYTQLPVVACRPPDGRELG